MSSVFIGSSASSLFPQTSTTSSEGSSTVHLGPISPLTTSAPVVEISEGVYTLNIKIAANPHRRALLVSWIAEMYDVPHLASLSQLATGCVTCHACHGCVTDFRPILGNPMEVTHVTSPGHVYIFPC